MAEENKIDSAAETEKFILYRQTGDRELRAELVTDNLYIAEIMSRKYANRGVDYEDIYQVACVGIMYAIERFDAQKGVRFATFATPTVEGEILRYFRDKSNSIRIPRKLYEVFCKAERVKRSMKGEKTSDADIALALGVDEEYVRKAYEIKDNSVTVSFEQKNSDDLTVLEMLGREDDNFIMIENRAFFEACMHGLNEREREFVRLRYYAEFTQKQIAELWGRSQMYVSRMEKKVLHYMRNAYYGSVKT